MNKIPLLIFIIVLSNFYVYANPTGSSNLGMSKVIIESKSSDILFFIDDSLYSRQRIDTLSVKAGYHSLRASNAESDLWSAVDWTWDGELTADSIYYFEIITKRFIMLNSVPYGADVLINGEFVGTTPYVLKSTSEAVELIKSNYMPVRIEPDDLIDKSLISINLVAESPVIKTEPTQNFWKIGNGRDKLTTYAITAISGVAAVYFKFEADKAFDRLSDAVDPADRQYLIDRVDKYDNLAAISFVTFQAGFLYSIYRIIRHR